MRVKTQILRTPRLMLGPIRAQDEARVMEIFLHSQVRKTYMLPDFQSREDAQQLFRRFQVLSADDHRTVYGIFLKDQLIGFLNDVQQDDNTIEMGYVIHPDFQNQGYATEAFSAVIQSLFSRGYTLIKAAAFDKNAASMRVMEKCGMVKTGHEEEIPYRGHLLRCIYYEIHRDSSAAKAQAVARIQWMEHCFDLLQVTVNTVPAACSAPWFHELLTILTHYYEGGQWLGDYELDEQGYFPKNLKRSVLSQDAVYDLLSQIGKPDDPA